MDLLRPGDPPRRSPLAPDADPAPAAPTLAGALAAFPPSALVSLLNQQKATGDLRLENYGILAHIYLLEGEVVEAVLGRDHGLPALFYALGWTDGHFEFCPGPVPARVIHLSVPVIQVRAALWMERWRQVDGLFPTLWHRVGVHPHPAGDVIIQAHQWQVLTRIVQEPISLVQLAGQLNQDVMAVARVAAELVGLGLAEVLPPDPDADGGPPVAPSGAGR